METPQSEETYQAESTEVAGRSGETLCLFS